MPKKILRKKRSYRNRILRTNKRKRVKMIRKRRNWSLRRKRN